jgi:solute carrier family 26 protein 5
MAYGLLATLPPIQGLYTGFFAPILYCFLGTSRHVSFGLMAVVTLMTGTVVQVEAMIRQTLGG